MVKRVGWWWFHEEMVIFICFMSIEKINQKKK